MLICQRCTQCWTYNWDVVCNDAAEVSAEISREQLDLLAESPQYWTHTRGVFCSELSKVSAVLDAQSWSLV